MYEAQVIAIEKQLEIDRLKEEKEAGIEKLNREKDDLLELMRKLAKAKIATTENQGESSCIHVEKQVWETVNDLRQEPLVVESATADKIEKEKNTILIIGNDTKENPHMIVLSADRTKWIELKLRPPSGIRNSGAAYLNGEIYLLGGQENFRAVYRLDENFKWRRLADMIVHRNWITNSCLAWNGYIWVFGGCDGNCRPLKSVERYDPKEDKWTLMPEMNYARLGGALALWNDGIIITGGIIDGTITSSAEYFNHQNNCWTELPNMPNKCYLLSFPCHSQKQINNPGRQR